MCVFESVGYQPRDCKTGTDFENWVQGVLTAFRFDAKRTGGNDNGVDIIATTTIGQKEYKYYIQCKFHNRPVGKTPIQEVYTGCQYFGGDGYPVVITNNRMSSGTKAFANKMGVELITELDFNELEISNRQRKIINQSHTGLMGIILARMFHDNDYGKRAIKVYDKKHIEVEEITDKERLRQELINNFDQANILMQEFAELQLKAAACQQQAMALQKEALLKNLNCP